MHHRVLEFIMLFLENILVKKLGVGVKIRQAKNPKLIWRQKYRSIQQPRAKFAMPVLGLGLVS